MSDKCGQCRFYNECVNPTEPVPTPGSDDEACSAFVPVGPYLSVLRESGVSQTPEFTSRVLSYSIGDIHKLMIYIERFGSAGYLGDLKIACADAHTQVCLLSEQLGYTTDEIREIGINRLKHRLEEVNNTQSSKARKCVRCGKVRTDDVGGNICGSCADDLRAERESEKLGGTDGL